MRLAEFVEAVESYGVTLPKAWHTGGTARFRLRDRLGLPDGVPGSPGHRDYSGWHVRRLVASTIVTEFTKSMPDPTLPQHEQATRLLAAAPEGWVVMADGRAWWSLVPPVRTLRSRCAVAIPVPDWKH